MTNIYARVHITLHMRQQMAIEKGNKRGKGDHASNHGHKLSTTFILVAFFHPITTSTLDDGGTSQYEIRVWTKALCSLSQPTT
jgi:hypothetical protein